jgi:diguanylate cyclase (GGDEF)-like protein
MMIILIIASAAALATTVLLLAGLLRALRLRDGMLQELSAARDRAEQEAQRSRAQAELAASIDLDEAMARTLATARRLPGVDAATVTVASRSGDVVVSDAPPADKDGPLPESVVVPLSNGDEPIGQLAVYARAAGALAGARAKLDGLARDAAPVLENARRFREARQLADLDALTGLHNQRFFHEPLARVVARARRYGRALGLIVLDIDDFKLVNDRIGHLAGDTVLAETAERIRDVVRTADVACRVGGDEFAVIMPEAGLADADQLYERISSAVSIRPVEPDGIVRLSAGVTELRPGDDAVTLFQRADEALYRAKGAGKATVVAVATLPGEELRRSGGGE